MLETDRSYKRELLVRIRYTHLSTFEPFNPVKLPHFTYETHIEVRMNAPGSPNDISINANHSTCLLGLVDCIHLCDESLIQHNLSCKLS